MMYRLSIDSKELSKISTIFLFDPSILYKIVKDKRNGIKQSKCTRFLTLEYSGMIYNVAIPINFPLEVVQIDPVILTALLICGTFLREHNTKR